MKKPKISLLMSFVFAEEKCSQALMDFLSITDVGRISGMREEVDSDHKELSDGGVEKLMLFFGGFDCFGEEDLRLCFCLFYVPKERGKICVRDMPWPLAAECNMITNKHTNSFTVNHLRLTIASATSSPPRDLRTLLVYEVIEPLLGSLRDFVFTIKCNMLQMYMMLQV